MGEPAGGLRGWRAGALGLALLALAGGAGTRAQSGARPRPRAEAPAPPPGRRAAKGHLAPHHHTVVVGELLPPAEAGRGTRPG